MKRSVVANKIHRGLKSRQQFRRSNPKERTYEGYQLLSPGRSNASRRDKNNCGGWRSNANLHSIVHREAIADPVSALRPVGCYYIATRRILTERSIKRIQQNCGYCGMGVSPPYKFAQISGDIVQRSRTPALQAGNRWVQIPLSSPVSVSYGPSVTH